MKWGGLSKPSLNLALEPSSPSQFQKDYSIKKKPPNFSCCGGFFLLFSLTFSVVFG
jgi:hypothetical protein